jgi:hypothetical protein
VPTHSRHAPLLNQSGRPPADVSTAELRDCTRHGRIEFHLVSGGNGQKRWRCKRCMAEAVTRRHQKIKRILVEEAGGGCVVCGYDRCVVSLHFHHVDPTTKAFAITTATGKSLDAYRAEVKKCVLVCANCHGEIEVGLIESPPAAVQRTREVAS